MRINRNEQEFLLIQLENRRKRREKLRVAKIIFWAFGRWIYGKLPVIVFIVAACVLFDMLVTVLG